MKPPLTHTCPCDPDCPKNKIIPPEPSREVSYFEKILRYIPAAIATAYMALDGAIKQQPIESQLWMFWVVFLTLLILCPLYIIYRPTFLVFLGEPTSRKFHAIIAPIAFAVFVFAWGGPFAVTWPDFYQPIYGTILLVLTTLIIPVAEKVWDKVRFFGGTKSN